MLSTELEMLKSPSLVLDIERLRRNALRIGNRVSAFGANLRPHIKTHKCIEIARLQTQGFSGAITVSTLAEARAFADEAFTDILYGVPIEPGKFSEAVELARKCERLSLITDDVEIPVLLNHAAEQGDVVLDLFLKVNSGYHRCGVEPESTEAVEISRRIVSSTNLRFAGILTHAGHSYYCSTKYKLTQVAQHERDLMVALGDRLRSLGFPVPVISVGSTPTITHVNHLEGVDEVRAGNYIFFDAFQATLGSCAFEDCALTVLAAVVHRDRTRRQVIVDAGALALSKDRGPIESDPTCGYGRVLDLAGNELGLRVQSLSQEHGVITVPEESTLDKLKVGTRLRVLPNHSCLASAQHSHYNVLEGNHIVDRWEIHRGW